MSRGSEGPCAGVQGLWGLGEAWLSSSHPGGCVGNTSCRNIWGPGHTYGLVICAGRGMAVGGAGRRMGGLAGTPALGHWLPRLVCKKCHTWSEASIRHQFLRKIVSASEKTKA